MQNYDGGLRKSCQLHRKGVEAEQYIKDAKASIARLMKVNEKKSFLHQEERNLITLPSLAGLRQIREKETTLSQQQWNTLQWDSLWSIWNPLASR